MKNSKKNIKLIFGLKIKQLRQDRNFSLAELAEKSGLSVSYLNEIESGKKYPKTDKIATLAEALGVSYDKLVSLKLTRNLAPLGELLESNIFQQLPLDHYGIDINKIIVLMANAPLQLSALVTTLIDMAKSSELSQHNFSRTALRTYKEFNENYFPELEKAANKFLTENNLTSKHLIDSKLLLQILEKNFNYHIDENKLDEYPTLKEVRSLLIPGKRKILLLNKNLSNPQKTFILGKELAYIHLNISDRAYSYTGVEVDSFDQLLNNFNASYFSTALIIKKEQLVKDIKTLFSKRNWNSNEFMQLVEKYNSTPEMFVQRLASLSSKFLNLNQFFFLRFTTSIRLREYSLTKELRLNTNENPGGYQSAEHYCRRWISINVLNQLAEQISKSKYKPLIGIQKSQFYNSGDQYLTISIARRDLIVKDSISSVTIGFLVNDELKKTIKFWNDNNIKTVEVNDTCERCPLKDCKERVAQPTVATRKQKDDTMRSELNKLIKEMNK